MKYQLPKLEYGYNALEPYIDAKTMEIHHTKHHQGYTDKMNTILEKYPDLKNKKLEEIMMDLTGSDMSEDDQKAFQNNGGGYINHALFWQIMNPKKQIDEKLVEEIKQTFSSIENFKEQFSTTAATQFGSGWAWLVRDKNNKLLVYSTPNQNSPYLQGHIPIFCLDVWEHAYYLKYQNKRPQYIENWWNVLKLI